MKQYQAINIILTNHKFFFGTIKKYINISTRNAGQFQSHTTNGLASIHAPDLITNNVNK